MLNTLLKKLTPSLYEKFEAEHRKLEIPTYSQLLEFLCEYCKVFASVSEAVNSSTKSQVPNSKSKAAISSFVTNINICPVCKEQHFISKCPRFLALSFKDRHSRIKDLNLCLNCLRPGHGMKDCNSTWSCRSCRAKHHTLLYFERSNSMDAGAADGVSSTSENALQNDKPLVSMASVSSSNFVVLLSTVRADALDIHGNVFPVRNLLDSASQSNFISEDCMSRVFKRSRRRIVILAVNDTRAVTIRGSTSFVI